MIASRAFSDVSCALTWLGMPLRSCGDDMVIFAKWPAAALCQPGSTCLIWPLCTSICGNC